MTSFRSRGRVRVASVNLQLLQYPRSEPDLYDAARFRALSTSHTVAADDGCTNIPLAACRAQEDENHSHMTSFQSRGRVSVASLKILWRPPRCTQSPFSAVFRSRALSTSHTVAADDGCTNIPLAACRAQEDENHSRKRHFRPWLASVRPPGSARTDQVQEDDGVR